MSRNKTVFYVSCRIERCELCPKNPPPAPDISGIGRRGGEGEGPSAWNPPLLPLPPILKDLWAGKEGGVGVCFVLAWHSPLELGKTGGALGGVAPIC